VGTGLWQGSASLHTTSLRARAGARQAAAAPGDSAPRPRRRCSEQGDASGLWRGARVGESTLLALEIIIRRANWSERITAAVLRPLVRQLPVLATWWHWLVTSTKPGAKVQQEVSASAKLLPITLAGARHSGALGPAHGWPPPGGCLAWPAPAACCNRPQPLAACCHHRRRASPTRPTPRRRRCRRPSPRAGQIRERSLLRVLVQANLPPEVYGSEMVRAIVSVKWTSFARTFLLLQVQLQCPPRCWCLPGFICRDEARARIFENAPEL
jgi:hypothetical protein